MVFFNFQQDADGQQEFRVSNRWWYYLAATIPTTFIVFFVWLVWRRIRLRKHQLELPLTNPPNDGRELPEDKRRSEPFRPEVNDRAWETLYEDEPKSIKRMLDHFRAAEEV
jgi:hypothetical protein